MALTWTEETAISATWRGVAWSSDLSLYAAVASSGEIMTSPDGEVWTSQTPAAADALYDIVWASSLGMFVAVGHNAVQTSVNGTAWVSRTPASADNWENVAWSPSLGMLAATHGDLSTTTPIMTSTNGTAWSLQTTPNVSSMAPIEWSPDLGMFIAASAGSGNVLTSTNGTAWSNQTNPTTVEQWLNMAWSPDLGIMVIISGAAELMTTTNGTSYTLQADVDATATLTDVVWVAGAGQFVISTQSGNKTFTSEDGITWTEVTAVGGTQSWLATATDGNLNVVTVGLASGGISLLGIFDLAPPATTGTGWYKSDVPGLESAVDATAVYGTDARPRGPRGQVIVSPFTATRPLYGFPSHAVAYNNRMLYAAGGYTVATDLPPIRTWNGTSDYLLAQVPRDGSGNVPKVITTMINGDGAVYLGTWDYGTTNADVAGRILKLDPNSGQLTNVGNVNSLTGYIPQALCFHNGELWAGLGRSDTTAGRIYRIKPDTQTAWTLDREMTTDSVGGCTAIVSYKGQMYFGSSAASGTFAKFGSRSSNGTYGLVYTGTGGTAQDYNGFYAAVVFNDNLYFSYWNPDATEISLIKKYDGSTVTTAFDVASIDDLPIIGLFVHDGVLYAIGSRVTGGDTYESVLLTSADGTTWADRTADLPLGDFSSRGLTNAFATIAY